MYQIDIVGGMVYSDSKEVFDILGSCGEIIGGKNRLVLSWENDQDKNSFKIILEDPVILDSSTLEKSLDTGELVVTMPEDERKGRLINIDGSSGYFSVLLGSLSLKIQYKYLSSEYSESEL